MALKKRKQILVGWREWAGLPEFTPTLIKAKIDTGARTSAIHAWNVRRFTEGGAPWVAFALHPVQRDNKQSVECRAAVHDVREIRSSDGAAQIRIVIRTMLTLGEARWPIELTLARRDQMGFRMLVGRTALRNRALVDPAKSYLCGKPD